MALVTSAVAQSGEQLTAYFNTIRSGTYEQMPSVVKEDVETVINFTEPNLKDSVEFVRNSSIYLIAGAARLSTDAALHGRVVTMLAKNLSDKSGDYNIVQVLTELGRDNFSQEVIASLPEKLGRASGYRSELIRLIGYVGNSDHVSALKCYGIPGNAQSVRWSALLAMARLGDADAINEVNRRARKLPLGDDVVLEIFPDLVYTRQSKVIDYMVEVLFEEKKLCSSADNDNPRKIQCGYRVMEMLAPVIENFPLEVDVMGEIFSDDYEKSLKEARKWFKSHRKDYVVKNVTY